MILLFRYKVYKGEEMKSILRFELYMCVEIIIFEGDGKVILWKKINE